MLHAGSDAVVAGLQHTVDGQIQRLGGVSAKHKAQGIIDPEKLGKGLAGLIDDAAGLNRKTVPGASRIGPDGAHEVLHGLPGRIRFGPGARRVVEIDHWWFFHVAI